MRVLRRAELAHEPRLELAGAQQAVSRRRGPPEPAVHADELLAGLALRDRFIA
jgi:hypothetical protein